MKRSLLANLGVCGILLSVCAINAPVYAQSVNCSGVAAWSSNSVSYAVGALVTYNGSEYKCIQAHTSEVGWDPVDAPSLWSDQGTCSGGTTSSTTGGGTCSAAPSAPTGLSASGTSSTGTNLTWTAPSPPANCSITGYTIYKNGASIGTSSTNSFAVSGLTASTTYSFTVAAADSYGTGSQSSTLSVTTTSSGSSEAPYGGTAAAIPGTVQAENYDTGGQGVAYNVTSTNGSDNGYRSDGVDLETTTDTGGGVDLGWTSTGQWFKYTVNVSSAGTYTTTFRVANGTTSNGTLTLENSSGGTLASITVAPTGGWQTWTSVTANVTLSAGQQVLEMYQTTGNYNINYVSFAKQSSGEAPYGGTAAAIPGTVQAENYDTGGQGVAYNVTSTNGSDNGYRSDGVDLETTTDTGGGVDLGWTATGQWFKYTVNVSTSGTYTAAFRVANGATSNGTLTLENSSGGTLASITVAPTGGWQTWTTVNANVTLSAGQQVLEMYQTTGNYNINYVTFTSGGSSCTAKPSAPGGLSASGTTSSSTNLSWNSVTAPANCSITGYTVYENGTAKATVSSGTSYTVTGLSASTSYTFTVAAVDSDGTGAQSSSINVTTSSGNSGSGPITNAVIGYWDNWGTFTMPNTSMNYKVLNYAFAVGSGTDGATLVMWTPSSTNPLSNAASDIAATKAQGRTVLLSLGGATSPNITLLNSTDVSNFVNSVESLVSQYGFQGIDLDFENSSVTVNAGDSLSNPTTPDIVNLASALHQIKSHFGSSFVITYVPETADIDAYSAFSGEWGGYLSLINATRDILTYSDTQCYDSGSMYAANGQVVAAGGADFMVAMSELLLHGYTISGGQQFAALNPSQVAFGNLYNGTAASAAVAAYKYLTKGTPDGGSYTLLGGPYPNMAGSMVWDANGDESQGYSYSNTLVAGGLN